MDLTQRKLTKFEWESIEMPESEKEMKILKMIYDGYSNLNISINQSSSILSFLKLDISAMSAEYLNCVHIYIYTTYFLEKVKSIECLDKLPVPKTKLKIKKADLIRFGINKTVDTDIFEFLLLDEMINYPKNKNLHYFTLYKLSKNNIKNVNKFILDNVFLFLKKFL